MGRKYGNKIKWKQVIKKEYKQKYIDNKDFKGYLSYIKFLEVENSLVQNILNRNLKIADKDYIWLQLFPINKNHCITIMFDDNKNIVKWYIDIVKNIGLTEENIPYMEDLYLDLIILPTGEYEIQDRDELDEAFKNKIINREEYILSIEEMEGLKDNLISNLDNLIDLSNSMLREIEQER